MILLSNEGVSHDVEDRYAIYSPYIHGAMECTDVTTLSLDRINTKALKEYVTFLRGGVPEMDDEIEKAFDFMGHPNVLHYPLDYWAIKLHDTWVRDNMYRLNLWEDPYYDLDEIPIRSDDVLRGLRFIPGIFISGSYALYLSNHRYNQDYERIVPKHDGIDVYATDPITVQRFMVLNHLADVKIYNDKLMGSVVYDLGYGSIVKEVHISLHLCRTPTELAHRCDLDCSGLVLSNDGNRPRLWSTKITQWSLQNRINWLDPDRIHASYAHRMALYMTKGFKPMLPLFSMDLTMTSRIQKVVERIQEAYRKIPTRSYTWSNTCVGSVEIIPGVRGCDPWPYKPRDNRLWMQLWTLRQCLCFHIHNIEEWTWLVPTDPVSILILSSSIGLYTHVWNTSPIPGNLDIVRAKDIHDLEWTYASYPETPIKDMKEWYRSSI